MALLLRSLILSCPVRGRHILPFWALLALISLGEKPAYGALVTPESVFPELGSILNAALEQSPRMVTQNLQRLRAYDDRLTYSAGLYPRINASGSVRSEREDRVDSTEARDNLLTYYSFGVSQPVFHWGALRANAEIGRIQAAIANNNFVEGYEALAAEIRRSYLQLILSKVDLKHTEFRLKVQEQRLASTREQVTRGEIQQSVLDRAVLAVDEARLALERTSVAFNRAIHTFRRLTGRLAFNAEDIPNEIGKIDRVSAEEAGSTHQIFLENGLFTHRVLENALLDLRSEEYRYRIIKVAQRPKIDFTTGINLDEVSYVAEREGAQRIFAGLSVSWNIFDGFSTRGRLLASGRQRRILENRVGELEENLRVSAEQGYRDLDLAGRELEIAERRFAISFGLAAFARSQLERGQGSQSAVDDAQMADNAAELAVFRARANYLNAVTAFLSNHNADPIVNEAAARLESLRKR